MPSRAPAPIKFPLHLWSTHVHVSFAPVENSVMSVTEKGFEERAASVFEKKRRQTAAMLPINFSINWLYLESSCFYFPQMRRKMTKSVLNDMFEDINIFLKRVSSSDQIKSILLCFLLAVLVSSCWGVTLYQPKIQQFPFIIP